MRFGVYPGGPTGGEGTELTIGPPDDPERIEAALADLSVPVVRCYVGFWDPPGRDWDTPADSRRYATDGRRLDLVLQYQSASGDVAGFVEFVRDRVRTLGRYAETIQVCEEPNLDRPLLDGSSPRVREALTRALPAARAEADALGLNVRIGFNVVPAAPDDDFFADLARLGGSDFAAAVDYVALDCFPDVFRPIPGERIADAVGGLVDGLRRRALPTAGLDPATELRIGEHGWPTGPGRDERTQSDRIETVVRAAAKYGVTAYTLFSLRDSDSGVADLFHQFGVMRSDYTPKLAYHRFKELVAELS
jgi:hypothetical protein